MGEASGVRWARHYLARGFPDRYTALIGMFAELERRLASGEISRAHQVACCSGREIAHFAQRFPRVEFTGSDADPSIVDFLRETWRAIPNLDFVRLRLENTAGAEMEALGGDLVYASGGLHYMDPESLRRFFGRARALTRALLLSQPLDRGYRVAGEQQSRPRRQLSWNHPYPLYLREAGWQRIAHSEGFAEELPDVKNVSAAAD